MIYLGCFGDGRDIGLDTDRPVQMKFVLIQLEQKYDEYEQGIDHEKREHGFVPQLDQIGRDPSLFILVLVDRVQVFVDQVPPELLFRHGQERHRTLSQRFIFDPEGIDVVVPFHSGFYR